LLSPSDPSTHRAGHSISGVSEPAGLKWLKAAVLFLFTVGGALCLSVSPALAPSAARTAIVVVGTTFFGLSAIGLGVLIGIDKENGNRAR